MQTIWKYPIELVDSHTFECPRGTEPLSVQMQGTRLAMWCLVNTDAEYGTMHVQVFGTGNPVAPREGLQFIDTVQHLHGLVWHVFAGMVE